MSLTPGRALLFEMLRSYTSLARTLNLSEAVTKLGSTRQTVRRHIAALEEMRGEKLFEVRDSQYHLTQAGARSLEEAEAILARGEAWLAGRSPRTDGTASVREVDGLAIFCAQQHHLSQLWIDESPLLQYGLRCWAASDTKLEAPPMQSIRPYWVVYRRHGENWLCVEVGDKSSYASWFGWTWAKSSVGRFVVETPAGPDYAKFISEAYEEVRRGHSIRLDHIVARMPQRKDAPAKPVSFQRLLLGCTFPDGEFALVVLVDRTYNITITGLDSDQVRAMSPEFLTAFDADTVST